MDNQPEYPTEKSSSKTKWFFILLVFIVIFGIGIYVFILIGINLEQIDSAGNSNSAAATGEIETTDDPFEGNPDASIVIVEFSDFQCPFCFQSFPIIRELISTYGDSIKFIYRDFPISSVHPQAQKAAEAGECAHDQGKFWEMHDKLFLNQSNLSNSALKRYAKEIGLDTDTFDSCLDNGINELEVQQDFNDGIFVGVDGTPTFFINGTKFVGVISLETFKTIIEQLKSLE